MHNWQLDAVPIEKQRAYAQRIQARRPAKVRELKESTRTLELIFFLRVTLLELTDALLHQTGRRVSDLVRHAYDRTRGMNKVSVNSYHKPLGYGIARAYRGRVIKTYRLKSRAANA